MNNVIPLRPRQRYQLRRWSFYVAAGTTGGACGYWALVSVWPDVFLHWLAGLFVAVAVLVTNGVWLNFYAHGVRLRRQQERRIREWRETQAAFQREVRAREAARLRAVMEAPTEVIPILRRRPRDVLVDGIGSPLGRLWDDLTEPTGDIGPRHTPPGGWRSGVA